VSDARRAHLEGRLQRNVSLAHGLQTYRRGAQGCFWLGLAVLATGIVLWSGPQKTSGAWLSAAGILLLVTGYLFSPILEHYLETTEQEGTELSAALLALKGSEDANSAG
jgi:hypothetical protein